MRRQQEFWDPARIGIGQAGEMRPDWGLTSACHSHEATGRVADGELASVGRERGRLPMGCKQVTLRDPFLEGKGGCHVERCGFFGGDAAIRPGAPR